MSLPDPAQPSTRAPLPLLRRLTITPFVALIRVYQFTLSPLVGGQCRYVPTCSHYGLDALRAHGVVRGLSLTARRLLRCHPWSRGGYDPVPLDPAPSRRAR